MNPFDRPEDHGLYPQIGGHMHQPEPFTLEQRMAFLEQRCNQLEIAIRELCNAIVIQQQVTNHNFHQMEQAFRNLVSRTMRPPKNMLEGPQETN